MAVVQLCGAADRRQRRLASHQSGRDVNMHVQRGSQGQRIPVAIGARGGARASRAAACVHDARRYDLRH